MAGDLGQGRWGKGVKSGGTLAFSRIFDYASFTLNTLLKRTLAVGLPIALQNLFLSGLNMVDTVMIGQLGGAELAAVALANQLTFLHVLFLFGLSSGAGVFVAQFWGKGDMVQIRQAVGLTWALALAGSLFFWTIGFFFPRAFLSLFSTDEHVVALGALYLKRVSPLFWASALSIPVSILLRSIQRSGISLAASAASLSLNTGLNYLLIFGIGPFPALGIAGAALATVIARSSEIIFYALIHLKIPNPLFGPLREYMGQSRAYIKGFSGRVFPVVVNEILWSLGMTQYFVVYGRMGTEAVAAMNITETLVRLMLFAFIGFGSAVAALIGEMIGRGEGEEAQAAAKKFMAWNLVMGLFFSVLSLVLAPVVPRFFLVSPEARQMASQVLALFAFFLLFKTTNLVVVVGILRGGGDTRFSLFFDMGGVWGLGVPLCYLSGLFLGLPLWMVYIAINLEEVIKGAVGLWRVLSKRWIHDVTSETRETVS